MEWLQQLNQAIEYIEDNLAGDISYDKAAQIACCSTHQFNGCFPISREYPCLNISGTGG
ncbi:hypothetical protein [Pelotomaculum propionicicum]|uniref:HTH araC/xylS-type domain-containing protein n=1 Tax=Pelotomaculum propionicicum TaxID=258475 RepID=A0A4Y7RSK1_9FIRM|nr:hypothetical protein Pmgp_01345 [Pelotomaculum propionicicum]